MENENITRAKELLRSNKLEYKSRYFFTNSEINNILSMNASNLKDKYKTTEYLDVVSCMNNKTLTSHRNVMLNAHKKLLPENQFISVTIDTDKKLLTSVKIYDKFFDELAIILNADVEASTLSAEDISDAAQGFLNFSPMSEFTETMINLEKLTDIHGFSNDKIKIVNYSRFKTVKTKNDLATSMNYPKKLKISIETIKTTLPIRQSATHEVVFNDDLYKKTTTELQLTSGATVRPEHYFEEEGKRGVPKATLLQKVSASFPLYIYTGYIHFDDGSIQKLDITSFTELRPTFYNVFGYVQVGIFTNELHVKVFQVEELNNSNIKKEDLFVGNSNQHNFWRFYKFCTTYINSQKVPMHSRVSDVIIFMEVLKTLVNFSTFDPLNRAHGIYAGCQDVGKTYIVEAFAAMRYSSPKMAMPGRMSEAGMFGGANQTLRLPDKEIKGHKVPGYIEQQFILIEEVGTAIVDTKSSFQGILETLKGTLLTDTYDIPIVGGGTGTRNATVQMTMNYTSDYKAIIRSELMKIVLSIEDEHKKIQRQKIGEGDELSMSPVPRAKSAILRDMVNKKDIFSSISTFPNETYYDKELNIEIPDFEAKVFRESIVSFREVKESNNLDINTSLPYPILKRLPFSVFGGINEIRHDKTNEEIEADINKRDTRKKDVSYLKYRRSLYIPNLRQVIEETITDYKDTINYSSDNVTARLNMYSKALYNFLLKKHPLFKRGGDEDSESMVSAILLTLMCINKESIPSYETCMIVERWMILQCTSITTTEAKSHVKLRNFIKKIAALDENSYKQLSTKYFKEK